MLALADKRLPDDFTGLHVVGLQKQTYLFGYTKYSDSPHSVAWIGGLYLDLSPPIL